MAGVILEAGRHECIEEIYGGANGILGILNEDLIDINDEKAKTIEGLRYTVEVKILDPIAVDAFGNPDILRMQSSPRHAKCMSPTADHSVEIPGVLIAHRVARE